MSWWGKGFQSFVLAIIIAVTSGSTRCSCSNADKHRGQTGSASLTEESDVRAWPQVTESTGPSHVGMSKKRPDLPNHYSAHKWGKGRYPIHCAFSTVTIILYVYYIIFFATTRSKHTSWQIHQSLLLIALGQCWQRGGNTWAKKITSFPNQKALIVSRDDQWSTHGGNLQSTQYIELDQWQWPYLAGVCVVLCVVYCIL